jgi:S1-C subfamily serine protease
MRSALARVRSALARMLAHVRSFRPRGAVLMALVVLLSAGVGYAVVSSLAGSSNGAASGTGKASAASSPAPTAAPAWLGVDTVDFPPLGGLMVVDVVPGSPADVAGLQPGDVITQIGNRPVQSPTDLESALAGMHPGQQIEIHYQLGPVSYTTRVTLRARPASGP